MKDMPLLYFIRAEIKIPEIYLAKHQWISWLNAQTIPHIMSVLAMI